MGHQVRRRRLAAALLISTCAAWAVSLAPVAHADNYVIVTHGDLGAGDLSIAQLRRVFGGKITHWKKDGQRVRLVLPASDSPEMSWLCTKILKVPRSAYMQVLMRRVFQGRIPQPKRTDDAASAVHSILKMPGAIGVVPRSSLAPGLVALPW